MQITAYQHSLADFGFAPDVEDALLPAQVWPEGQNIVFRNKAISVATGAASAFSATTSLIFLVNAITPSTSLWAYASTARLYATDGTTRVDITRYSYTTTASGTVQPYTGTEDHNWTAAAFGNFFVFCNGTEPPQSWAPDLAAKAANLTGWPAGWVAQSVRSYRNYLVAMDLEISGTRYPTLLAWSDAAAYGTLPTTWTPSTTNDAGDVGLEDTPGFIVDGMPLGQAFIVYKEDSVWSMNWVGGAAVMSFRKIFPDVGLLSRRCVQTFQGRHFFVGRGDFYVHDGVTLQSIGVNRVREYFFTNLDPTYYARTFTAIDPGKQEIWVCYPDNSAWPNKALVWNYQTNVWYPPRTIASTGHIATGILAFDTGGTTFDTDTGTFDGGAAGAFDARNYNPSNMELLSVDTLGTDLLRMNSTYLVDGSGYIASISRPLLPLAGMDVTQQATIWSPIVKLVRRIFVDVVGTGTVRVYVGTQNTADSSPTWMGPWNLSVGEQNFVWVLQRGRFISVRFEGDSNTDQWTLLGYKVEWDVVGVR